MSIKTKASELSLLKIDVHDLVKQISLKDMELFKAITIEEINTFYWTKPKKKDQCPNLMMSHKQFNKINLWVQNEILVHNNSTNEVKLLSRFIKLSKCLLDYNNFQSAYAVKAALDSTPIHRLEQLWSRISKKDKFTWERLCSVFSVENNYQNLRSAIAQHKPPLIPFLGMYLSDLTGLDAAHPKVNGKESEIRKSSLKTIYDTISYYQQSKFDIKQHHGIQEYIQSMEYIDGFENIMLDSYFYKSKAREPDSISKESESSQPVGQTIPQIQILTSNDSPTYKKRHNLNTNGRESYRVVSEKERQLNPLILPDSPTLTDNIHENCLTPDWMIIKDRNLLDDSEVLPKNRTESSFSRNSLRHSNSTLCLTNGSLMSTSPTINLFNDFNSLRRSDIETKSYIQYDPDILSTNKTLEPVLVGLVKRKIKSKNAICLSGYQKVLAKLFMNKLECCLNFYTPKISKPKSIEDFRDEFHAKISLIDAKLDFESLINDPKIYINLPHESYIIQSIEDDHDVWPSIHKWWTTIMESINTVTASKASICQNQSNLINLDDEFTRL